MQDLVARAIAKDSSNKMGVLKEQLTENVKRTKNINLDVKQDFGAIADGISHPLSEKYSTLTEAQSIYPHATALTDEIDWCAIRGAIDHAKKIGVSRRSTTQPRSDLGMEVLLPSGVYIINKPLVMPRSGDYAGYSVSLCGANPASVILKGTNSFVSGQSLIEWEQIALRTYYPTIKNIVLVPPNVEGVKCIYYKVTNNNDVALIYDEYINFGTFENIVCEGDNGFHDVSIHLEGLIRCSEFKNIRSNYSRGTEKYSTVLIKAEKELGSGGGNSASTASVFYENKGIGFSKFERIDGGSSRGGWCTVFEGRLMNCKWDMGLAGSGALPKTNVPSFNFVNCGNVTLTRFYTEGRAERPQYRFENCKHVVLDGVWIGFGDDPLNHGNGIELINSQDCVIKNRPKVAAAPSFGDYGGKVIIMDANSKRNKVLNFQIKGSFENEIIDLGSDNYFELYDVSANKSIVKGGSKDKIAVGLVSATNNIDQTLTSATLTKVVFGAESYDTDNWYDTTNSRFTPKKAGYYRFNVAIRQTGLNDNARADLSLFKNGSRIAYLERLGGDGTLYPQLKGQYIAYANGTNDYFEVYTYTDNASGTAIPVSSEYNYFQVEYIGA